MKNLVCFAVIEESQFFQPRPGTDVIITGMGQENARKAVAAYLCKKTPSMVFSSGFAGGLDPSLALGAIVFTCHDSLTSKLLESQGARGCNFLASDTVATTASEKQQLRAKSGADAVEMESHAIAEVCKETNVPCTILRVISDTALEDLPLDFNKLMTRQKKINFVKLAIRIMAAPGKISQLIAFRKKTIFAAQQLATVLSVVTAQGR